ncbi:hypothetical protein C8F01DRAFT_1368147 [Mycena amicta]|nr:hypothetical protein C8F01DRAFT_1368147 [Mycena amicta]
MNKPPPRKIRFAPLPDPRRSVLLSPDGTELPLPDAPELPPPPPSPLPRPPPSPASNTSSLPPPPPSSFPKSSSTWPRPKSLLRSFRKGSTPASSTDSLTPTPSLEASQEPSWGSSLQRWSSGGSTTGSPLARTQSQNSTKRSRSIFSIGSSSDKAKDRTSRVPPALNPFANSLGSNSKQRGTRMLNGRVYGSRNADGTHNPFGNARDEDPQFVEWGYGGMGSVRHGVGSAAWNRVQAGGAPKTNGTSAKGSGDVHVGMGVVGDGDEDGDDGSGMGWVRRRREAREREAKERAEKEKEDQQKNDVVDADSSKDDTNSDPGIPTPTATGSAVLSSSPISTPQPLPDVPSSLPDTPTQEEEHVLRAVNLPAGFRGHHHSHSHGHVHGHHRSSSNALSAIHVTPPEGDAAKATSPSSVSSSGSDSESESDSEDEEDENVKANKADDVADEDDDEDDEDDEEEEKRRVTALSAGVEKISRHKE